MKTANQTNFLTALQIAYAELFANNPDYAYVASKYSALEMAEKMTLAAMGGKADLNGEGFKRACNACGIKHTEKSIRLFLSDGKTPEPVIEPAVKPRKVRVLGLSNIHSAMSGVRMIYFAHDLVTIEYTDGTREAAMFKRPEIERMGDDCLKIVSAVQAKRVPLLSVALTMTPNAHERAEWSRLAADARSRGFTDTAGRFDAALLTERMPPAQFDALQTEYRQWLTRGFAVANAAQASL